MAVSHFVKHLTGALFSRTCTGIHPFPLLLACSCSFSFLTCQSRKLCPPTSVFILKSSSFSSSASSSTEIESSSSKYFTVRIWCRKEIVDTLSEALLCFGASSTSVDEEDSSDTSDEICVETIFSDGHDIPMSISQASDSVSLKEIPHYEIKIGEECDWVKITQESFNPIEITKGLWIVPQWRTPPDVDATNIILNPGLAFGTGEHPTTKLCILLLSSLVKGGERFLDYGTGSGVLSIAALKFGAASSVGIDIDPLAIASAKHNADLNNIGPDDMKLQLISTKSSILGREDNGKEIVSKYDLVVANILLNPLLDLADHIVSFAKPGGIVGLSGILSEQVPCIIERYSQYLEDISVTEMDDWGCVSGKKRINVGGEDL